MIVIQNVEMSDLGFCKTEEFDVFSGWILEGIEVGGTDPSYCESNQGVSHVNTHVNVLTPWYV